MVSSKSLEELPIRKLYALAKSQSLRVGITIAGPIGKSYMWELVLYDGKPNTVGTRTIAKAQIYERTLDDAVRDVIDQIA